MIRFNLDGLNGLNRPCLKPFREKRKPVFRPESSGMRTPERFRDAEKRTRSNARRRSKHRLAGRPRRNEDSASATRSIRTDRAFGRLILQAAAQSLPCISRQSFRFRARQTARRLRVRDLPRRATARPGRRGAGERHTGAGGHGTAGMPDAPRPLRHSATGCVPRKFGSVLRRRTIRRYRSPGSERHAAGPCRLCGPGPDEARARRQCVQGVRRPCAKLSA